MALAAAGVALLALSVAYHVQRRLDWRRLRASMAAEGLIYGESAFPVSLTLIAALLLLALGFLAVGGMAYHLGPLG